MKLFWTWNKAKCYWLPKFASTCSPTYINISYKKFIIIPLKINLSSTNTLMCLHIKINTKNK